MNSIPKNIIFDLGGVLINISVQQSMKKFITLLKLNGDKDLFPLEYTKAGFFIDFEIGKISAASFRNEIRKYSKIDISDIQIDEAWGAMLLDFPPRRIEFLKSLKTRYQTFLFSNTNEIHVHIFNKRLCDEHKIPNMDTLFKKVYYSNELGTRKPKPEGFEIILRAHNLNPLETLFIDDTLANIETAAKLGMLAYHIKENEDITEVFAYLNKVNISYE